MLIVHVDIHVVAGRIAEFLAATKANANASLAEPGVLRFDVLSDLADADHVVLVEVYRDAKAAAAHKETEHYAAWAAAVAELMAVPRSSVKFAADFPAEPHRWQTAS
jgi:(4S)-4-hydroxy-5-phosphonooxypentane-2,3-dione isomerase